MLTAIVVGIATTALALALVVRTSMRLTAPLKKTRSTKWMGQYHECTLSSAIDRNAAFGCAYLPLSSQRSLGSRLVVTGRVDMPVLRLEHPESSGWRRR